MDRAKILVVDDESRMRKLVRDFLVREGYNVLEAEDGVEAMDIFYEEKDISLLILDVMMPRMDGWQVCREIRESSKVPIIMLTARSEERDELLTYFVENRGIALSREKILNNVWNYDYFGDARTIDTHVKKLRSKLGDKGEYIRTIWGMGYKFDAE